MARTTIYQPGYESSWALVIGINQYQTAPPLAYARQDAEAFAAALGGFGFPSANVTVLLDAEATRDSIRSNFLRYAEAGIGPDDRIAVFFAGHGCTRTGSRGEIGYLVPVDGAPSDLSTLIRWDELTSNAELIPAKHLLCVMDACYGGLAITRSIPPGTGRFVKDMLQRYSRQVLTAGKADEKVADSGGPRPGHSVFTGHLLDALDGGAASGGVLSANGVMAYVYDRVSKDPHSHQTPHYGFFEGDGDFIFSAPALESLNPDAKEGGDILVQVPPTLAAPTESPDAERSFVETCKHLLADPGHKIRLDDLVTRETRAAIYSTTGEEFSVQTATPTPEEFAERIKEYESRTSRLRQLTILLARWAPPAYQPMLARIISRSADTTHDRAGKVVWIGLRWYPVMLLQYSGGIAAISEGNYDSLATLLTTKLGRASTGHPSQEAIVAAVDGILDVERGEMFKRLPGHERHYVPKSEYLFAALQPELEDLLFLGTSYEDLFDKFEVFYALVYADISAREHGHIWGPPGRFGYKARRGGSSDPYSAVVADANAQGTDWGPLKAGLFGGSLARFNEIVEAYRRELLSRGPWF